MNISRILSEDDAGDKALQEAYDIFAAEDDIDADDDDDASIKALQEAYDIFAAEDDIDADDTELMQGRGWH